MLYWSVSESVGFAITANRRGLREHPLTVRKKATFVANHDRLKPCADREVPGWMKSVLERTLGGGTEVDQHEGDLYCYCQQPWNGRL